jgi:hypothetical protein
MTRQKILSALLIASFGAVAATAGAQTYNTPAPAGTNAAPPTATTDSTSGGTMAPSDSTMKAPGTAMDSTAPTDMSSYKAARRVRADKQPNLRDQCRVTINTRCLAGAEVPRSGSALDDCLKGDTGQ